jgi:hypothetical protein
MQFSDPNLIEPVNIEKALLLYCTLAGTLSVLATLFFTLIDVLSVGFFELFAVVAFISGGVLYGFKRASALSRSDFKSYWKLSLNYSFIGSIGLLLALLMHRNNWGILFVLLGVGSAATLLVAIDGTRINVIRSTEIFSILRQSRRLGIHRVLANLLVATSISLLLSNGAVAFGLRVGVNALDFVAYSAMLNIVLVPMTMLNSLSAPLLNRAVDLFHNHQLRTFTSLYIKSLLLYFAAISVVVVIAIVCGQALLHAYVGKAYAVSPQIAGAIALSEGIGTLTVLPRFFLVASGATTMLLKIWIIGICSFFVVLVIPISPLTRIVLAPGLSGGVIVVCSSIYIWLSLKRQ